MSKKPVELVDQPAKASTCPSDQVRAEWLPADCRLDLTQLEIGALWAILREARRFSIGAAIVNKPGPQGEPVPISIVSRLIEKVELCVQERKNR